MDLNLSVYYKFHKKLKTLFTLNDIKDNNPAFSVYSGVHQYVCSFTKITNLKFNGWKHL